MILFVFIGLTTAFCVHAQNAMVEYGGRRVVNYGEKDSVGLSLDYSNTICDTLLYDGRIILLERSPLLQLKEMSIPDNVHPGQSYDSVYNCARGYTATWKLDNKRLLLLNINLGEDAGRQMNNILKSEKFRDIGKKPIEADWVSGKVPGGSDAVKTNYGYAFKQEYEFEISKGLLLNATVNVFPVGSLEDDQALLAFLKENSNALLGIFLHFDTLDAFRNEKMDRTDEHNFLKDMIPLMVVAEGETYYASSPSMQKKTVRSISLDKSMAGRLLIARMNFANMLPKGSFYPHFLRGGAIYRPLYIEYSWNLYGDIDNVELQYYTIVQGEPLSPFWKKANRWDY